MNHRIVLSTTGTVLYIEAAMMLIPLLIAMGFKEHKQALAFLAAILIATGVGFLLLLVIYLLIPVVNKYIPWAVGKRR